MPGSWHDCVHDPSCRYSELLHVSCCSRGGSLQLHSQHDHGSSRIHHPFVDTREQSERVYLLAIPTTSVISPYTESRCASVIQRDAFLVHEPRDYGVFRCAFRRMHACMRACCLQECVWCTCFQPLPCRNLAQPLLQHMDRQFRNAVLIYSCRACVHTHKFACAHMAHIHTCHGHTHARARTHARTFMQPPSK